MKLSENNLFCSQKLIYTILSKSCESNKQFDLQRVHRKGNLKYLYLKTLQVKRFEKLCIFHVRIELKREADEELKVVKDFS